MINVVKIGGNVIDNPRALEAFLNNFRKLSGPKVLVHGGGREATALSAAMGIETHMVDGRRITDADTLRVVTMVYAGLINKRVVALLQKMGCDAVGLSGADANLIEASRRSATPIDFGFVGDIDSSGVNDSFLMNLLRGGYTPVICSICHDGHGTLLNCNADSVASAVAVALASESSVRLTYCFEKPGVLADPNDDASVIRLITPAEFARLKEEGTVAGGMLPKITNALQSAAEGVAEVRICQATELLDASGTLIVNE